MEEKFIRNPMIVKDDGKVFKIVELKKEPYKEFRRLELQTINGNFVQEFLFENEGDEVDIEVDRRLGTVVLVYFDEFGKELCRQLVDVFSTDKERKIFDPAEVNYKRALDAVKQIMDQPEGTERERSDHTRILNMSIVDENARLYIYEKIRKVITSLDYVKDKDVEPYIRRIYASQYGMSVLQELDDDPEVGEIIVNAFVFPKFRCDIYYIKNQVKYKYEKTFETLSEVENVFRRTIAFSNKDLNSVENSMVEAIRPNRDRVNIIIPKASDNWGLNIRKFTNFVPDLNMMKKSGTVDDMIDKLMAILVRGKANIGIGGEMGTGKTTFINFLLTYTPPIERKVVIASVSETDVDRVLRGHDVVIFNVNEELGFTFEKLVRASLRTTADRVIIPESRGGEFKQLYEVNLKTKGNMFTAHALEDEAFLDMCVDMYMSSPEAGQESAEYIKNKITKAIDIVVMMRRVGNKIRIKSISEAVADVHGNYLKMNRLYEWKFDPATPTEGRYGYCGNLMTDALCKRLNEAGVPKHQIDEVQELLRRGNKREGYRQIKHKDGE